MLMPLLDPNHSWLWWIVIGGLAGALAKLLMPGRDPGGCLITILLGIAGAVIGAFIILFIYRLVLRRRTP